MMHKAVIFLLLFNFRFSESAAQINLKGCPKVFFNSRQVLENDCDSAIKNIGVSLFSGKVIIKHENKTKTKLSPDSIWGYRYKNDYPCRLYKGDSYQLFETSPVLKYSRRIGKFTKTYFSVALDSPLLVYEKEMLAQQVDSFTYKLIAEKNNSNIHVLGFNFFVSNSQILNQAFWGAGMSIRYYVVKKLGTGIYLSLSQKMIKERFGFIISKPMVTNFEFAWLNQFDLIQTKKFRAGITMSNGIFYSSLQDKAIKLNNRKGYKKVSSNFYYLMQPGLDISLKLFSNEGDPDFYLNTKVSYRKLWGNSRFGTQKEFDGLMFGVGISLIGFDKEKF